MEEDIFVYPAHEIHLARTTAGASSVSIQVFHKTPLRNPPANSVDYTITDVTAQAQLRVVASGATPLIGYVAASGMLLVLLGGAGTGQDTLEVSFRNAHGIPFTLNIPVFVHERLDDWWLGNNRLSVPQDRRVFHCQVSVYAHFDAPNPTSVGTIADITGHGFPNLSVADPAVCELDSNRRGRVKGLQPGSTQLTATFGGKTETLPVTVINFYGNPTDALDSGTVQSPNAFLRPVTPSVPEFRKTCETFSYGTGAADRFNILFLAEGYTAGEQALFDTAVAHFVQQMFNEEIHQPYKMLSGSFNVWKAFMPSAESGVTDTLTISIPGVSAGQGLQQARDSFYGLYKPRRNADVLFSQSESYKAGDPRRYPPELNWAKAIGRHIASLSDGSGTRGSLWYNDLPVSPTGADFLKDYGLVVMVYNASRSTMGDAHYGPFILQSLAREASTVTNLVRGSSAHQWKLDVTYPPVPANPVNGYSDLAFTTFVMTHELSHTFNLGDEYENSIRPYPNTTSQHSNIVSFHEVRDGSSTTDVVSAAIKWKAYDRMEKAERILSINSLTTPAAGKIRINVTLATNKVSRWQGDKDAHTKLYLREFRVKSIFSLREKGGLHFETKSFYQIPLFREVVPPVTPPAVNPEPPLVVIKNIAIADLTGNNGMDLDMDTAQLPAGISGAADVLDALRSLITVNGFVNGVLYKPKMTAGEAATEQKLIRPEVSAYIDANKIPLDRQGTPSGDRAESPPAGLVRPRGRAIGNRFPFKVIGLYEGGDHAATNVFRPTGDCRMRNSYTGSSSTPAFCHVCQYYIVSLVNPAMLEVLETSYPDFS